jgi:uncharacterized membrane protein
MNFPLVMTVVLGVAHLFAPLTYLALAWGPADEGSVRGVWLVALSMMAMMGILASVLVLTEDFGRGVSVIDLVLPVAVFTACVALLHAAIRRREPEDPRVALVMTAMAGLLAAVVALWEGFGSATMVMVMIAITVPVFIVCAALMHVAIRRRDLNDPWVGWITGAAAAGYLTLLADVAVLLKMLAPR